MFILAQEFLRASKAIRDVNASPGMTKKDAMPHANVLVHAMCLEILLKCLYVLDRHKPPARRHNLKEIFESLLPETQKKIREYFDPTEGQMFLDHVKAQHRGRVLWNAPVKFNFDYAIFACSKTFEWVRYAYERDQGPTEQWVGTPLVDATHKLILERRPQWASITSGLRPMDVYIPSTSRSHLMRKLPEK